MKQTHLGESRSACTYVQRMTPLVHYTKHIQTLLLRRAVIRGSLVSVTPNYNFGKLCRMLLVSGIELH